MISWRIFILACLLLCSAPSIGSESAESTLASLRTALEGSRARRLLDLCRATVSATAEGNKLAATVSRQGSDPACGLFVTLVKRGVVRGCYGDLNPSYGSLEEAAAAAAEGAATQDPRSIPVEPGEVDSLDIVLSLTLAPEPVLSLDQVDPDRYGLLVISGGKRAVLLPGEARTSSYALRYVLKKAGMAPGDPFSLFKFRTLTFLTRGDS